MAKGKALIPQTIIQSFHRRRGNRSTRQNNSLTLKCIGGDLVLTARSQPPAKATDKQLAQRLKWCDCDHYLRTCTIGQELIWISYYWSERHKGRTKRYTSEHTGTSEILQSCREMGYYAYFMHRCLLWDLLDFLYNWFKARWELLSVTEEEAFITVKAMIVHRYDVQAPKEPRIFKAERITF